MRLEWEERRDAFPASLIAMQTKDKTPADIMKLCGYPTFGDSSSAPDPDRGAATDMTLKRYLKGDYHRGNP